MALEPTYSGLRCSTLLQTCHCRQLLQHKLVTAKNSMLTGKQLSSIPSEDPVGSRPTSRRSSLNNVTRSAKRLLPVSFRLRPLQQKPEEQFSGNHVDASAQGASRQAASPNQPGKQTLSKQKSESLTSMHIELSNR